MSDNTNNNFNSKSEGMDYLIKHVADEETKNRWRKEFPRPNQVDKSQRSSRFRLIILISGVAATVLVGMFIFNSFSNNGSLASMASNELSNTVIDLDEVTRGESDILPEQFTDAYKTGNYINAVASLISTDLDSSRKKFFYAVALAKSGEENNQKVLTLLNEVIAVKDIYYTEALWIRALTLVKEDQLSLAKNDLLELKDRNYKSDVVSDLLSEI